MDIILFKFLFSDLKQKLLNFILKVNYLQVSSRRSAATEGTPGCVQLAGKYYLPAILQYTGRSNLLAKEQDDGVPSDFVLGMTLAIYKLLFLSSVLRLTLISAGGRTSVSLNILLVLVLQNRLLLD